MTIKNGYGFEARAAHPRANEVWVPCVCCALGSMCSWFPIHTWLLQTFPGYHTILNWVFWTLKICCWNIFHPSAGTINESYAHFLISGNASEELSKGVIVNGRINKIQHDLGLHIQLAHGVRGTVHVTDIHDVFQDDPYKGLADDQCIR